MFCSKLGVSTELNVPTPHPSLLGLIKRCSLAFSKQKSVCFLCTKRYIPCEKFGAFEGRTFDLFEKKNSKRARACRVKKRKKKKKRRVCFCFCFLPRKKKKFFTHTKHTDIKYQIPLVIHFLSHERKHTHIYIYIYYYHI